jgi:hypothetical protein
MVYSKLQDDIFTREAGGSMGFLTKWTAVILAGLTLGLAGVSSSQEAGDTCASAGVITQNGSYNFNTTGASADDPCFAGGLTVWFQFTATADGPITADLCGSSFDTYLTVFQGPECPVGCVTVADDDDSCGDDAVVQFDASAGTTYYFAINGSDVPDFGPGVFNFTGPTGPVEAGDTCDTAVVITQNGSYNFDTTGASGDDPCLIGPPTVWYRFTAPINGTVNADLCGSSFDTYISVFEGETCPANCEDGGVVGNDDNCGVQSAVSFPAVASQTYYFAVSGNSGSDFGPGVFNLEFNFPGNTCADAVEITDGFYNFDTTYASADDPCFEDGRTVWFRYTAPEGQTTRVEANTCGSSFDTYVTVYEGPDCPVLCPDEFPINTGDDCGGLVFAASPGQTYYFAVNGDGVEDFGFGVLNISTSPLVAGDACADAGEIVSAGTYVFDSTGASANDPCSSGSPTVWYRFDAQFPTKVVLDTGGTSFDTVIRVFTGTDCTLGCNNLVTENDQSLLFENGASRLVFNANPGQTYFIVVHGYISDFFGPGVLNVDFMPIEAGDACDWPILIAGQGSIAFDTTNAPFAFLCSGERSGQPSSTRWYEFLAPSNGSVQADTCGSSFDTYLSVFEGPDCPAACENPLATNDDSCGYQSSVEFPVTAGQIYRIVLSGFGGEHSGPGTLNFTFTPNAGDTCDVAGVILGNGLYPYDTTGEPGGDPCFPSARFEWFRFFATQDGAVLASLDETSFEPYLRVFGGADCPVSCSGVVDEDIPGDRPGGKLVFEASFGETYHFSCTNNDSFEFGPGVLNFQFIPAGGDFNNDGIVNVADVTEFARLLGTGVQLPVSVGDFNEDAAVDELDVQVLAELIVNQPLMLP